MYSVTRNGVTELIKRVCRGCGRPYEKQCEECEESFSPARRSARFCSGKCRQRACRKRKAARV